MSDPQTPKLRREPLPATGYLIIRGAETDAERIRTSARLFIERNPGWALYGLSGFYAQTEADLDAVCAEKLPMWESVDVYRIEDLLGQQLRIEATFRTPHVTLLHPDLDQLVQRLAQAAHDRRANPYYEPRRQP